jgi:hypothetical protein
MESGRAWDERQHSNLAFAKLKKFNWSNPARRKSKGVPGRNGLTRFPLSLSTI